MTQRKDFPLGIAGFRFSDLYDVSRLPDLHRSFWDYAEQMDAGLHASFLAHGAPNRHHPDVSEILIRVARQIDGFIVGLFQVSSAAETLRQATLGVQNVFAFKEEFWNHRVLRKLDTVAVDDREFRELEARILQLLARRASVTSNSTPEPTSRDAPGIHERAIAELGLELSRTAKGWLEGSFSGEQESRIAAICHPCAGSTLPEKLETAMQQLSDWGIQVYVCPSRRKQVANWLSFVRPNKLDYENLVPLERHDPNLPELVGGDCSHIRLRDGFGLTDARMTQEQYLREADYCILCHPREKDSCSQGLREKDGSYKTNPLGILLEGCPLDERISEMHALRREGYVIGALAMIMLDNPMCPGTGHRICNDCMKGCIFQKQDPVNIPQIETGVLSDVLQMPWGFEIYSLLTRFNPLHRDAPYALPYNGIDVLVVGLGPAGYTLAHYLTNMGFGVVGIDGLKLEPIDDILTGADGELPLPIQDFASLMEDLDTRLSTGFGGVSEYGITVRWDKNFLKLIYLTLLRRRNLRVYGGVRFGGTLTLEDAWERGFRHVALATGAGRPTIIPLKNNLIRGIRKASDFLMSLQLTGAFKRSSLANLQVQLPAIVVGGGLTAIDTATELMAYYPVQVEKTLEMFEVLTEEHGEDFVWRMCDEEEQAILKRFLEHGRAIRDERARASRDGDLPNLVALCQSWGGVNICYRKRLADAPAYRLNHEEVKAALEEGIYFTESAVPMEAHRDRFGALEAVTFQLGPTSQKTLPARSLLVAAGTSPNTVYEKEHPQSFELDEHHRFFRKYQAVPGDHAEWSLVPAEASDREAFFLSYQKDGRFVSFYGDNHPNYAGNVVKAMASAKVGSMHVARLFGVGHQSLASTPIDVGQFLAFTQRLDQDLMPRVVRVDRLTPTIVDVIIEARYCAQKFQPGQFYRLQNYEAHAPVVNGKKLTLEGIALTGAWVDTERGLLSLIVLEMGVSSRLCAYLRPGEPVVLMGPTGVPSEIPAHETVLLVGGGLGNAVLLSISRALKKNGCRVIYFAGYRSSADLFKQQEIEDGTDQVIWAVDADKPISARRPQDRTFVGNIVQAMLAYASGQLQGAPQFDFASVDRIFAIGSDRMMAAVSAARHGVLQGYLRPGHAAIASVNSLMQCMMKEICAQCLQKHVDPETGCETDVVFTCFNQDQEMDRIDFPNLRERLKSNSLAEKLSNKYLDVLLQQLPAN
ncbi:MAG: FAD-dependent oxidoreductase [Planctomycetota bacterium]|nr:FAD-dependent oxidoreductase [Planctomycetota bacterium]